MSSGRPDHSLMPDNKDYDTSKRTRVRKRTRRRGKGKESDNLYLQKEYAEAGKITKEDRVITESLRTGKPIDLAGVYHDETPEPTKAMADRISKANSSLGAYQKEYQMRLLHRMLLRNLPMDMIAQSLGINVKYVYSMRTELMERLADAAKNFDVTEHVGSALGFYNEVRGTAMRIASDSKVVAGQRIHALYAALEAQKDTVRFMQAMGAYENSPMQFNAPVNDPAVGSGNLLLEMSKVFLDPEIDASEAEYRVVEASEPSQEEELDFRVVGI